MLKEIFAPWRIAIVLLMIGVILLLRFTGPPKRPPTTHTPVDTNDSGIEVEGIVLNNETIYPVNHGLILPFDNGEVNAHLSATHTLWWRNGGEVAVGQIDKNLNKADLDLFSLESDVFFRGSYDPLGEWTNDPEDDHLLVKVIGQWHLIEVPPLPKGEPFNEKDGQRMIEQMVEFEVFFQED